MLVAKSLLRMEDVIISMVAQQLRLTLSARTDEESQARLEQDLESLSAIKSQMKQIQLGKAKIHEDYLIDEYLLRYWEEANKIMLRVFLWDPKEGMNYQILIARIKELEYHGKELRKYLAVASIEGQITSEIRHAIHQKWAKFDHIVNAYHQEMGTEKDIVEWPLTQRAGFEERDARIRRANKAVVAMVWWIFGVAAATGTIFMGIGFFYSSSKPGHWRDPDFWSLLQSTALQLCGLVITGLSFHKPSRYEWLSGSAGTCFALIAPILYVRVPTQYSMWSSAVSGVFQALLILQLSIYNRRDSYL